MAALEVEKFLEEQAETAKDHNLASVENQRP